ncbi:MAG TPA: hypothetical protein VHE36_04830 [Sphingomicrobium sp.]|nr:hypothetical protein [Sphingomicrobium sp.]
MSAALALMLFAEAVSPCARARELKMPGGATIVRPVGTSDPAPFERLGPAPSLLRPQIIHETGSSDDPPEMEMKPAPEQCVADPVEIV